MDEAILWQIPKLEKNIWILDTSVTLAPLMGLLGTIIGMVHAFDILGVSGASGSATEMISGGIAEALVATGAGILIAIIAVVFLNHFNKKNPDSFFKSNGTFKGNDEKSINKHQINFEIVS